MKNRAKFTGIDKARFFETLKNRVNAYFEKKNISKKANWNMFAKTIILLSGALALYLLLFFGSFTLAISFSLSIALGTTMALIGFNICHDAIHGAYSRHPWINEGLALIFNIIGANVYVWKISHNQLHHTYTNIAGQDTDLEVAPGIIRVCRTERLRWIHRYQHIYAFALYSLASLSWFFRKDYVKFFNKSMQPEGASPPKREFVKLIAFKVLYYFLFLAVPFWAMEFPWWQVLLVLLAMYLAEGAVIGSVFQLAHLVEQTAMPHLKADENVADSWAIHQMKTTANFARRDRLISYLFGGLNFQIEHHLFPQICHVHYPLLSLIVHETAAEFGVPYIENRSLLSAIKAHVRFLKKMGRE
jgi:linoleoyl-CoA desaturase